MQDAGYLIIATGKQRYLELATNLTLSLKLRSSRPVCLLTDESTEIPSTHRAFFDVVKRFTPDPVFNGTNTKFLMYEHSPFQRTLYLDADILLFKDDVEDRWQQLAGRPIAVEGEMFSSGVVHRRDTRQLMQLMNIPYVVNLNGGAIYFEKCDLTQQVFHHARALYRSDLRSQVGYEFRPGELNDEPFWGVTLPHFGLQPLPVTNRQRMLQSLTPYGRDYFFDIERGDFSFIVAGSAESAEVVSGTFCHFANLEPLLHYLAAVYPLRRKARLPEMKYELRLA
jgi:hypothetical protein